MQTSQWTDSPRYELHRTELTPMVVRDAVLTAIGILALASIAVIHLVQIVPTFEETPLLGAAFVLLSAGAVALAVRLVVRSDSTAWTAIGLLSASAVVGYVLTRVVNTPLDNVDVGNWACMLGIAALFVEVASVALSSHAVMVKRSLEPATAPVPVSNGRRVTPSPIER